MKELAIEEPVSQDRLRQAGIDLIQRVIHKPKILYDYFDLGHNGNDRCSFLGVKYDAQARDKLQGWIDKYHLDPLVINGRDITFSLEELSQHIPIRAKEMLAHMYDNPTKPIPLDIVFMFLMDEKRENDLQQELEIVLEEAKELIAKVSPDLVPKEPTELNLIGRPNDYQRGFSDILGCYLGKFQGKHQIAIREYDSPARLTNMLRDKRNPFTRVRYRLSLAHELIHQKHAEIVGQDEFWGDMLTLDSLASGENFQDVSLGERFYALNEKRNQKIKDSIDNEDLFLKLSFIEAATTGMEILLAYSQFHNPKLKRKEQNAYRKYWHTRLEELGQQALSDSLKYCNAYSNETYIRGLAMMRQLFLSHSPQEIMDLYKRIDVSKLHGIQREDNIWHELLFGDTFNTLLSLAEREK